ncbi:MAG: DUF1080 domain-containing protein [Verrucomicrobiales bacterium]|nr:DUF1080 domain-containing protein [Verrucomicrobiales bacterium]
MQRFIFCLCLTLAASALGAEIKIDFNGFAAGSTPTNFHAALAGEGKPGAWKIVLDEVPPLLAPLTDRAPSVTKRAVLAQTSQDATDEHFPLFIYDGETFNDFKLTTRFKIVSGIAEQMAGVVFHFQNASNFYVVRASALGHNVRFYKMVDGIRSDPIGPQLEISTNTWHTLAVQCHGNQITCWLDDQLVMPPLQDNTFASGKIGFWTKSDAVSYFCDPAIEYTPRIPAAQMLVRRIMEQQPRILGLRIYTLDDKGVTHVIASKDEKEIGQPGTDAEKDAITDGKVFYGRDHGIVVVTLPFRDRNGDAMAAMRVRLKSFIGETQNNALTRATMILKNMQAQVTSSEDLLQ